MCALLQRLLTWCHHYKITLRAMHIPGCLNVMADLLSRSSPIMRLVTASAGVQTDLSKWFTPCVDLFVTRLNQKVPLYVSLVPDQHVWNIDALNMVWSDLTAYAYPPTAFLHRVITKNQASPLPHHCNSPRLARHVMVLGPSAALNRDSTPITSVTDISQTAPQASFTTIYSFSTFIPGVYERCCRENSLVFSCPL